jgi:hypothetical protein
MTGSDGLLTGGWNPGTAFRSDSGHIAPRSRSDSGHIAPRSTLGSFHFRHFMTESNDEYLGIQHIYRRFIAKSARCTQNLLFGDRMIVRMTPI